MMRMRWVEAIPRAQITATSANFNTHKLKEHKNALCINPTKPSRIESRKYHIKAHECDCMSIMATLLSLRSHVVYHFFHYFSRSLYASYTYLLLLECSLQVVYEARWDAQRFRFFLSDLNVTNWCSFARNRCYWVTKYKSPQPISFSFIQIHMNLTTHHILLSRMCSMISVFFGNHEFVLLLSFGIFVVEERSWVWHFWPTAELGHFIQKLDLGFSTRSHFRHRFFVQ